MAIAAPGIGSNLDVNGIVSQLMAIERRPLALLDQKEAGFQARLSAYGVLKGALSSFQTAMQALKTLAKFQSYTATAADPAIFSASADSSAAAGSYAIVVGTLAQAHVVKAGGLASDTAASSTGTIQIRVGNGATTTVTIDATNNTLRGVRDAINAANAGVSATIVNDGSATPYRLVLTAAASGAAQTIQITNNLDAGELKDAIDNRTTAQDAQDAALTVNGVAVTSASNTVDGAIPGVSLKLLKIGATTLTVANDAAGVRSAVQSFVKAYNDINQAIADLTSYDPATSKAGLLLGDFAVTRVQAQIRATLSTALTGLSGNVTRLSQIGVAFQTDGSLALDSAKLTAALDANFGDIGGLFAAQGKSSNALLTFVSSTTKTGVGAYSVDITAAATQGAATAANAPAGSTVIDGANDAFSVTIDGVASGTLSLEHGTYTASELVAALQDALDGSSAFAADGVTATVALDGGKIRITSERYGTASTVSTAGGTAAAALGFTGAESGAGTDVAGSFTLDGTAIAATGSGQLLTAASGSAGDGLQVKYVGTASQVLAGTDATLNYSEGYAVKLERLAADLLATDGTIDSRTQGANASIKDLDKQRDALNRRLEGVEARLRAQFTALDTLIARLATTSNFLQQQLAALPTIGSSR